MAGRTYRNTARHAAGFEDYEPAFEARMAREGVNLIRARTREAVYAWTAPNGNLIDSRGRTKTWDDGGKINYSTLLVSMTKFQVEPPVGRRLIIVWHDPAARFVRWAYTDSIDLDRCKVLADPGVGDRQRPDQAGTSAYVPIGMLARDWASLVEACRTRRFL